MELKNSNRMNKEWNEFANELKSNGFNKNNVNFIKKAWHFVIERHDGQFRKSGEPYVFHLLETAKYLLEWGMDTDTIIAGLLHDVLEDTETSFEVLKQEFSKDIAAIVYNVTKTSKLSAQARKEIGKEVSKENDDYIINLLLSVSSDIRILTVKMADRYHNIQTIQHLNPEKQMRIAIETFNIYATIAGRLGMYHLKTRLLDLSYAIIEPENYKIVKEKLQKNFEKNQKSYDSFLKKLESVLIQSGLEFELKERKKGIHSTSTKLRKYDYVKDIKDIFAVRIVLKGDEVKCFQALGLVHLNFKYIKKTFKDYISKPKGNLYQSLHTVIWYDSTYIEVQIRTELMDQVAQIGIAAHWKYKQTTPIVKEIFTDIIETIEYGKDSQINIHQLKMAKLIDVYVVDNDQYYSVPNSWTILDVAYRVSSEKLPYLISPIVDNKKASLFQTVHHNDKIDLVYSENFTINKKWLNYCSSVETKAWIEDFLDKIKVEEDIISKFFYSEISNILGDKYVGNEELKIRIVELGFQGANDLLAYLYHNHEFISQKDILSLASKINKTWREAARKIKRVKEEMFAYNNLYFEIPNYIVYRRITYPSCCTKAPSIDCVGQLDKKELVIHNYKCPKINLNKQKYIIPWNQKKIEEATKIFNVILQFNVDSEKTNDIIAYLVNYQMKIKKVETLKIDRYTSKMTIHIGCASTKAGQNILIDLNSNFYITKAEIV